MMLNGSERNKKKCPSTLEKRLTYISWTLFTVAVSLAMGILIILRDKNSTNQCLSPSCIHSAAMILQTVDATQSPCDNFYKFSCGNYLRDNYVQNNQLCLDNFALLHERIQEQLKIIIESPLSVGAPKPYHQLQMLYNLCMNKTAIEREGIQTALDLINSVGSCPLLIGSRWNATDFHWTNLVYNLKRVGLSHEHFITLKVSVDEKNSSYHILTIEPTKPSFATTRQSSMLNHLLKITSKFGVSTTKSIVDLKDVLDFAERLSNIYVSYHPTANRSAFYNQMTIRELQYRFPKTDWMEYVTNIVSLPDVKFSYKETIVVRVPQYLSDLETILDNTPSEVQANYIIVRILVSLISLLSRDLSVRIIGNEGSVEGQPGWKECINIVQGSVSLPLLAMYAGKYFKNQDYQQAREIAFAVEEEFRAVLNESEWLDEITKQIAINKLNAFSIHVGLPSLDDTLIVNYYDKLEISSENYLKAMMSVNSFQQHMHYNRLRQLVSVVDWMDRAVNKIDVLYSQTGNKLYIPGHILQGIFFNASRPRYLNYATVGSLIGKEITTGFNDIGRQYDKHGNINEWWGAKTEALFREKGQCAPSMFFNSIELRTQVETLGLTGGLKQSYLAYMKWKKGNATEEPLAGVSYNQEQLFWISAAQLLCRKCGNINFQDFAEYRVNEAFRNLVYFSRDFKCPLGSPMNPTKKCTIW